MTHGHHGARFLPFLLCCGCASGEQVPRCLPQGLQGRPCCCSHGQLYKGRPRQASAPAAKDSLGGTAPIGVACFLGRGGRAGGRLTGRGLACSGQCHAPAVGAHQHVLQILPWLGGSLHPTGLSQLIQAAPGSRKACMLCPTAGKAVMPAHARQGICSFTYECPPQLQLGLCQAQ